MKFVGTQLAQNGDVMSVDCDVTEAPWKQQNTKLHLMPNTHRRRRCDETVELRRVGGVNTPVGSRDPVYNILCWQVTSNDIMTSLLKIHEYYTT